MTHKYKIAGMTGIAKVKSELLKPGDILSADIQLQVVRMSAGMIIKMIA